MFRTWTVCVLLIGAATSSAADNKLEWKFKEGDTFYVENVTKTKQSLGAGGKANATEKTTTAVARYKVIKTTADGAVLEMQLAGTKVDGNDPVAALAGTLGDKLKEVTFRVTLSTSGQVTKFEGFDAFVKMLVGDNEASAKTVRSMGLEELYVQGITQTFGFLPAKNVARGDKWKQKGVMPLPIFGSLKTETEYAYQGPGEKGEQITFTETFTYELPKAMEGTLLKITKGNAKVEPSKGTIVFDPTTGRLVRLERPFKLKGTFTFDANGKEQVLEMEQESTTVIRVFKENPLK